MGARSEAALVVVALGAGLPLGPGRSMGMGRRRRAMALFTFLARRPSSPPRYGLDHEFAVDDEEFLSTMAGGDRRSVPPAGTASIY